MVYERVFMDLVSLNKKNSALANFETWKTVHVLGAKTTRTLLR